MIKMLDHKYIVSGVFETEHFVFLSVYEYMAYWELRKLPKPPLLTAIYNKRTGETFAVKQIIDDLGGMKTFFPSWGACNEKLLATVWPYKLKEFIRTGLSSSRTRCIKFSICGETCALPILTAIYNKRTGETFAVKQIIDDLGGMKTFSPSRTRFKIGRASCRERV